MLLSQSLRGAAHLCEALGLRAGAHPHPTFLLLLHLGQDVPDLPLGQLQWTGQLEWMDGKQRSQRAELPRASELSQINVEGSVFMLHYITLP